MQIHSVWCQDTLSICVYTRSAIGVAAVDSGWCQYALIHCFLLRAPNDDDSGVVVALRIVGGWRQNTLAYSVMPFVGNAMDALASMQRVV